MEEKSILELLENRNFDELFETLEPYLNADEQRGLVLLKSEWEALRNAKIHRLQDSFEKEATAESQFVYRLSEFVKKVCGDDTDYLNSYPQFEKFVYIKAIHWTKRVAGKKPVYTRYLDHLDKEVEVFDELMYLRMNRMSTPFGLPEKPFYTRDRSKGSVSVRNFSPWCPIQNTDDIIEWQIDQNIKVNPAQEAFLFEATYFNGFQEGNEDVGTQIEYGCQQAKMLVDFSSIPHFSQAMVPGKMPSGARVLSKDNNLPLTVDIISPKGIFMVAAKNLNVGEKLLLNFRGVINWDLVP